MPAISLARQIKAARALLRWSTRDLAAAARLSADEIARIEADDGLSTGEPRAARAVAALRAAGIEFLIGGVVQTVVDSENAEPPRDRKRERGDARRLLLAMFDEYRTRVIESGLEHKGGFIRAFLAGRHRLPAWAKPYVGDVSIQTFKRWLSDRRKHGPEGLDPKYRGRISGVLASAPDLQAAIVAIADAHPDWSNFEVWREMQRRFPGRDLPTQGTVGRLLRRQAESKGELALQRRRERAGKGRRWDLPK